MKRTRSHLILIAFLLLLVACSTEKPVPPQSNQDKETGQQFHKEAFIPDVLRGERWLVHFQEDLLPYWISEEAKGSPQGNFPTFRGMDGRLITDIKEGKDPTVRYPRMLARQVYFYSTGYLLTGDDRLLQLAKDGCDWLTQHAWDNENGGWFAILDKKGQPIPEEVKYAQDTAYVAQAFATYFFVTRDPEIEAFLLKTRDLIFNNYWDDRNKRVYDGMTWDLKKEVDQGQDNGWELVAQLDQINAYMMVSQPVLTQETRRAQFLSDMKTLADTMVNHFLSEGIFWGIHNNKGKYNTRHVDFGHTLKSYWMLLQLDKRLPGHPYLQLVEQYAPSWLELALNKEYGTWGEKMLRDENGNLTAEYGALWWTYAELDQIAATLNFSSHRYTHILAKTTANWLKGFVDHQFKEVYFSIKPDGSKGWEWKDDDVMKCNWWKNGFHSAEHALIMYIHGKFLENKPVHLHFAVTGDMKASFIAKPYIFEGREIERKSYGACVIDQKEYQKVKISFTDIR